jgi:protein phosphatase
MTDPAEPLFVPAGALVVLVGPAGAGKTTLAARLFPAAAVLSSDAMRARIGSGEADQTVTRAAFEALHRALDSRLARRELAVVDATNVTAAARAALLRRARRRGSPALAGVLAPPHAEALARNAARQERIVPSSVVSRHVAALSRTDDALLRREGFGTVRRLRSQSEIDGLRVVLGTAGDKRGSAPLSRESRPR